MRTLELGIQEVLKRMGQVHRETHKTTDQPAVYFSVRFYSDGSGYVIDSHENEVFEFLNLHEFVVNADEWMLDQYPDRTTPDVYDGMQNYEIEVDLAMDLYRLLIGLPAMIPTPIPFPEWEVDVENSSIVIHLAGRKINIRISVEDEDVE